MSRTDRQLARLLRAEEPPEPPPELLETLRRDIPHLPPAPRYPGGVMAKYAALVSSASEGAVTTGRRMSVALGAR